MALPEVLTAEGSFNDQHYKLIRSLSFDEIPTFVFDQIRRMNRVMVIYFVILGLLLVPVLVYPIFYISNSYAVLSWIFYILLGFVFIPVILIPLHEGIHGVTYFLSGARHIKAGVNWKLFYFYVTADRFPVNALWFRRIAWSPALILSVILLLFAFLFIEQPLLAWSFFSACFVHFTMCIGDAAMADFMQDQHSPDIMTIDDLANGRVYFYVPAIKEP